MSDKKVSIIIPCKEMDSFTEKCLKECLNLNYSNYEILVLPDESDKKKSKKFSNKRIKIIKTGKVKPSVKRNLGMKKAKGNFFAFIDSDAYPEKNWLKNAVGYFEDSKIGLVGGPNLTPPEGNFVEKISGYVLANFWTSGFAYIRYRKAKNQFVKELPSCNYITRKEISPEYNSGFLTAEDSKFCFDIKKEGYKILYAGNVVVYHHRRDTIKKHLRQMYIYGRDIAWLSKEEFSFDKLYFSLLSLFSIAFIIGIVDSIFSIAMRILFLDLFFLYFSVILFTSIHENIKTTLFVTFITMLTHFSYGIGFLYGIFFKNPDRINQV
ncbi:MAG: glycosyltransferase [Candidatus Pacearchaeota archaeon]|nr:glycosyltransferase [Candidatus Pacearchaeota archaeon]